VLGGRVSGGSIVGEQQRLARDTLFQDRDYSGTQRLSRRAGRLIPFALGILARSKFAHLSTDGARRSQAGVTVQRPDFSLDGKVAVITGASRGIGTPWQRRWRTRGLRLPCSAAMSRR